MMPTIYYRWLFRWSIRIHDCDFAENKRERVNTVK